MPSCRKKGGKKNGKAYSKKMCQNQLRQCVLRKKDSSEKLWGWLNAFETPQLTLWATCKRTQQFTMLRLFIWSKTFDWFQTLRNNSHQHATTCNRVCKLTQQVASNRGELRGCLHEKPRTGATLIRDDFLISYRVYVMTESFHISLFEGTLHVDKMHVWFKIANITHALPIPLPCKSADALCICHHNNTQLCIHNYSQYVFDTYLCKIW